MTYKTFDDFLQEKHYDENPQLLDDDIYEHYEMWLGNLDNEELMNYCEEYNESNSRLEHIFQLQYKFGKKFTDFGNLSEEGKKSKTLEFIDHCIEELIEMRREIPSRKDWSSKKDQPVDQNKLLDEYIDVLHFYISLALINGWGPEDIYKAYLNKNKVNHTRQKNNY